MSSFFERELRILFDHDFYTNDPIFVGNACFVKLGDNIRARIEFAEKDVKYHYEGIKATVINKNDGPVDSITLHFEDLLGRKRVDNPNFKDGIIPYIWRYNGKVDWYVYQPTAVDCQKIMKAVNTYLELFRDPALELSGTVREMEASMEMQMY